MPSVPDAIVIGSGPNGLTAAAHLARAGWSVMVLEAQPTPGGAVRTRESTIPGFLHDLGAAFFPFGPISPAFGPLDLPGAGLVWRHAPMDSAHPAPDGSCASLGRDLDATARALGPDGETWRRFALWHARSQPRMLRALLSTLPALGPAVRFGPLNLLRLLRVGLCSGRRFAESTFRTAAARRVLPGLALHTDVGPDDAFGAALGFVLAVLASTSGFGVPEGGAEAITRALLRRVREAGGTLRCGARVERILVRHRRVVAVRVEGGDEIEATRAVLADVGAPALYLRLLDPTHVPARVAGKMRAFKHGFGTFKMDWALSGPVPWRNEQAARAAVVHAGDSLDDLASFTREVRSGTLPARPYLVVGQQSIADPTRAPKGQHTLWAYSRVPFGYAAWATDREAFADRIDARIEELAPGFRKTILGRAVFAPPDLEAMNENLVGGDLAGGSAGIRNQLFFRPVFPYFRYRTPVRGLYLASSYAHPGAGVHGACGYNAALAALADSR
jgi:phytoene dehydrogenase-like protein